MQILFSIIFIQTSVSFFNLDSNLSKLQPFLNEQKKGICNLILLKAFFVFRAFQF
jgi:hypothetical protein